MSALAAATILPPWLVLPMAVVTLLVIAAHVLAMQESGIPVRRRRIRSVNGVLMMFITCLLAYALAMHPIQPDESVHPQHARTFILVWLFIISLLGIVVALAGLDAAATLRMFTQTRRRIRRQFVESLDQAVRERLSARRLSRARSGTSGHADD